MSTAESSPSTPHPAAVTGWVRDAYPSGVPDPDVPALLTVLEREVGSEQTMTTVLELVAAGLLDAGAAASARTGSEPGLLDLRRVSGQLVVGGWPLARFATTSPDEDDATEEGSYLGRIIAWLRDGYPQGVPRQDRVPLLALLRRRLTDEEVEQIAHHLARSADDGQEAISSLDAQTLIMRTTDEVPTPQDLERVAARLAARGWPLEA